MKELERGTDVLTSLQRVQSLGSVMRRIRGDHIQKTRDTRQHGRFACQPRCSPKEVELMGRSATRPQSDSITVIRAICTIEGTNPIHRQAGPRSDGLRARFEANEAQA